MEYKSSLGMKVVTGHQTGQGISEFINTTLHSMPRGQACPMWELAKEVRTKYPHLDKQQSYIRINQVMKRAGNKGVFRKLTDASDYLLIGWAADHGGSAPEEEEDRTPPMDATEELWEEE